MPNHGISNTARTHGSASVRRIHAGAPIDRASIAQPRAFDRGQTFAAEGQLQARELFTNSWVAHASKPAVAGAALVFSFPFSAHSRRLSIVKSYRSRGECQPTHPIIRLPHGQRFLMLLTLFNHFAKRAATGESGVQVWRVLNAARALAIADEAKARDKSAGPELVD